jgi:hypothetical protein
VRHAVDEVGPEVGIVGIVADRALKENKGGAREGRVAAGLRAQQLRQLGGL